MFRGLGTAGHEQPGPVQSHQPHSRAVPAPGLQSQDMRPFLGMGTGQGQARPGSMADTAGLWGTADSPGAAPGQGGAASGARQGPGDSRLTPTMAAPFLLNLHASA